MTMDKLHVRALRTLAAMQVAVIEHNDEDISGSVTIKALLRCNKEWHIILKELEKTP